MRIPFLIIILLILMTLYASIFVWTNKKLNEKDRLISLISIVACCGALISATFVVSSYLQTNFAFILSQKPHLLVQVITEKVKENTSDNIIPMAVIHYVNTTSNPFMDLSFDIKVAVGNRNIDLSELFTKKMYMAAYDQRNRRFNTLEELKKHGIDINDEIQKANQIVLKITYYYTFNRKLESVKIQPYKWDNMHGWQII